MEASSIQWLLFDFFEVKIASPVPKNFIPNQEHLTAIYLKIRKITAVEKDSSNPKLQWIMSEDKNN